MRYKEESVLIFVLVVCFCTTAATTHQCGKPKKRSEHLLSLVEIFRRLHKIEQQVHQILTEEVEIGTNIPILEKIDGLQKLVDGCFEKTGMNALVDWNVIQTRNDYILNALEENDTRYKANVKYRDDKRFKIIEEYEKLNRDFPALQDDDIERQLNIQFSQAFCIPITYFGRNTTLTVNIINTTLADVAVDVAEILLRVEGFQNNAKFVKDEKITQELSKIQKNIEKLYQEAYLFNFVPQLIAMNKDIQRKLEGVQNIYDNVSSNYLKVGFRIVEEISFLTEKIQRLQVYVRKEHTHIKNEF